MTTHKPKHLDIPDDFQNIDLAVKVKTKHVKKQVSISLKPKKVEKKIPRKVIYGVTNRSEDNIFIKINDFLIDHSKITLREKSLFFNSLKLLVSSGVNFTRSLAMLSGRTKNVRLARILNTIIYDMEQQGFSFSQALGKYPDIFSTSEVKMLYSGELMGKIEETLDGIATQMQKNISLHLQIKSAMMYPMTVFVAILIASLVVLMVIVPRFESLFLEFSAAQLPWATRMLMGTSNFIQSYWWFAVTLVVAIIFAFKNWKSSEEGERQWHSFLLRLPLLSNLINDIQTVRISQNFGTLMDSGIPLAKVLRVLSETMPNRVMADALADIEINVRNGQLVSESFRAEKILDPVLSEVLEVGERTGQIPEVLKKLGDQYEMEVDAQLKNLTSLIEPVVILVVGGAVIFMAMAIMMPIFKLQELFIA